jgi:hypothetical protein
MRPARRAPIWRLLLALSSLVGWVHGFGRFTPGNVLLMDHLNLNHEASRHDLVKAFYFDVLGLVPDPRKAENMEKGRKTLWANAGITQFHLPEAERSQVSRDHPSEPRKQHNDSWIKSLEARPSLTTDDLDG